MFINKSVHLKTFFWYQSFTTTHKPHPHKGSPRHLCFGIWQLSIRRYIYKWEHSCKYIGQGFLQLQLFLIKVIGEGSKVSVFLKALQVIPACGQGWDQCLKPWSACAQVQRSASSPLPASLVESSFPCWKESIVFGQRWLLLHLVGRWQWLAGKQQFCIPHKQPQACLFLVLRPPGVSGLSPGYLLRAVWLLLSCPQHCQAPEWSSFPSSSICVMKAK